MSPASPPAAPAASALTEATRRPLSTTDGQAAGRDIAWTYPDPLDDALRVRDRIAFWSERTDTRVGAELQPWPATPWSIPAEEAAIDVERLAFG